MLRNRFLIRNVLLLRLAHFLVGLQNNVVLKIVKFGFVSNQRSIELDRFGTEYGGWYLPKTINQSDKVLLSVGLGHDTSFDQACLRKNFRVVGIDPLVECCNKAKSELVPEEKVIIIQKGLSTFTGTEVFYQPKEIKYDSWSVLNAEEVKNPITKRFEVISLEKVIKDHLEFKSETFSYLKMDIEGAELNILLNCFDQVSLFSFIGIELDFLSLIPFFSLKTRVTRVVIARKILKSFRTANYSLVHNENFNLFWVKQ